MNRAKSNKNEENIVTFYQNPAIDILFGNIHSVVPSKRQDFKPVDARFIDENGDEQILRNLYERKPSTKSVRDFEEMMRKILDKPYYKEKRIAKPATVEVVISISLTKSEFEKVDVDNVAKTILDSIKGYIFEDDSQVARLVCDKFIHPLSKPSFLIAVTELKPGRNGLHGGAWMYSLKKPVE